jgi:hypothetical protein
MPYTVKLCYRSIYFLMSNDTELFAQKNLCTGSRFVDNYGAYHFLRIMSNFSQLITTIFFYAAAFTNRNRDVSPASRVMLLSDPDPEPVTLIILQQLVTQSFFPS